MRDKDDCISRKKAKERLRQNFAYMRVFGIDRCLKLIDELPAVETEPKWIPCDERLPENDERVLICGVRGGIAIARKAIGNPVLGEYVFWVHGNKIMTADAWMPLPARYKGGDSE